MKLRLYKALDTFITATKFDINLSVHDRLIVLITCVVKSELVLGEHNKNVPFVSKKNFYYRGSEQVT